MLEHSKVTTEYNLPHWLYLSPAFLCSLTLIWHSFKFKSDCWDEISGVRISVKIWNLGHAVFSNEDLIETRHRWHIQAQRGGKRTKIMYSSKCTITLVEVYLNAI